ncbi:hypothetical protein SAMN05216338_1004138 [Bradyrhizobium sp. Rc2d]|nr:hypothetical protein SAMN05216338_1004138 [Bradyrhizobium sp. Rc2d]
MGPGLRRDDNDNVARCFRLSDLVGAPPHPITNHPFTMTPPRCICTRLTRYVNLRGRWPTE